MKKKFHIVGYCLIAVALITGSCNNKTEGGFVIKVNYKNADKMVPRTDGQSNAINVVNNPHIVLEEIPYGGDMRPVLLDSSVLNAKSGQVVLKGSGSEEGIYQLIVENGPVVILINDVQQMDVEIDLGRKDDYYTVKGSEASQHLKDFITHYDEKAAVINQVFIQIDSLKQFGGSDALLIEATNRKNESIALLNAYLENFIEKVADSPAESMFALGMCSRSFQKDRFEKLLNSIVKKFPAHKALAQLKTNYDTQQAQLAEMNKKRQDNSWIGKQVPDLALPSTDGKVVSIASFRGKYVLVDFWASWCGPCRQENPNVVKTFNEFKDKNFTVLGVSLDKEKASWQKAIRDDQLTWTHISDLQMWSSKAVETFKFEGIPFNVLVDPQGKIIAESLRGADLENKLKEVLQ